MGRAQVFQAEAARVKPVAAMNPILLKPTGEKNAQVIIGGKSLGNYSASEYHAMKPSLKETVQNYYNQMADNYEVVLLEGAGSPAEINLMEHDLVNMGMAELAEAPVILIGDIDRGGVFAALYGTLALLPEGQRKRVKGLLINKFRGDEEILKPGLRQLEDLTGVPVLGVIPYGDFDIEEEDGTAQRLADSAVNRQGTLDVAVIKLPRISNFTDFHWLAKVPGVHLRFVSKPEEMGTPNLLVIPGTKNTIGDLAVLREKGLDKAIIEAGRKGSMIAGICGGYQMLGKTLEDPEGVAGSGGCVNGLGLLPVKTVFAPEKVMAQVKGNLAVSAISPAPMAITGYEIHMGLSSLDASVTPFAWIEDPQGKNKRSDGAVSGDGRVWGTYLHGIFDNKHFVVSLIQQLTGNAALVAAVSDTADVYAYKEKQYDLLAKTVRESVDLTAVYQIMGIKS